MLLRGMGCGLFWCPCNSLRTCAFEGGNERRCHGSIAEASTGRTGLAGGLLGISRGGFFDGILLHQILQWHHLLSAIDPENARMQVMADGLLHALIKVLACVGLWLLWRAARDVPIPAMPLIVTILAGFGIWHLSTP